MKIPIFFTESEKQGPENRRYAMIPNRANQTSRTAADTAVGQNCRASLLLAIKGSDEGRVSISIEIQTSISKRIGTKKIGGRKKGEGKEKSCKKIKTGNSGTVGTPWGLQNEAPTSVS
ncbi:hypothetical protein RUM43_003756 [Polyplax serrata]|uniref:Uncharacterized protein n=1 Tax=Polyplax serrata TaxID=468196 RepID=A0AAN8P3M6_POLSC